MPDKNREYRMISKDLSATPAEVVAAWDSGDSVFTIEMGGLGPGYEQALQILVMEILRDCGDKPLPEGGSFGSWGDSAVSRTDKEAGGYSGAQVGAAKSLAYWIIRDGYAKTIASMEKVDGSRVIQVSRFWPKAPVPS